MTTLKAEKRNLTVKAKKLRRDGYVPGVICGKEIGSLPIQIEKKDAERFIKDNKKGGQVQLLIGDEKMNAIVKDFSFNAMRKEVEIIDFQELVKGEVIHTAVEIVLKNEDLADGSVTQELSEIQYKAAPEHLIDTIVLDFEQLKGVRGMKVADLEILKDSNIHVMTSPEHVIFSVVANAAVEEDEEEAAAEETK